MKRCAAVFLSLLLLFCPIKASASGFDFLKEAGAAVIFDTLTEKTLFEYCPHKRLPVASTTKIMTSLLSLEDERADEPFKAGKETEAEGSSMGLKEGDEVTLRTLALGMLLSSGNDAANAAAVRISGSLEKFVSLMNERAEKIGMKDTHFSTPSGLDCGENLSSAFDMALLSFEALKDPAFRDMVRLKTSKVCAGERDIYLKNHNRLLFSDEGFTGIKTGFTKKAGRCLVSSFEAKGREFIVVTLNLFGDFDAHRKVKKIIEGELTEVDLSCLFKGGSVKVCGGNCPRAFLHLKDRGTRALFTEELKKLKSFNRIPPFLYAPLKENEKTGEFIVKIEEKEILALPLYTSSGVELKVRENLLHKALKFLGSV